MKRYDIIRYKIMKELDYRYYRAFKEYRLWSDVVVKIYQSQNINVYDKYLALIYAKRKMEDYAKEMDELELLSVGDLEGEDRNSKIVH